MSRHIATALKLAARSRCRYKHACVLVRDGRIISQATNKKIGDPAVAWRTAHVHAEAAAVGAAGTLASGAIAYVARVNAFGEPAPSAPCKRCQRLLDRAGVARVVCT
jgi:pyrimidine deaminase RibD-like protein